MHNNQYGLIAKLGAAVTLLALAGCGWVDSTGEQAITAPAFIDSSLIILDEGDSFEINENTQRTLVFSSSDSRLTDWGWELLEGQANIRSCQQFDNFELVNASNSLSQTCASNGNCVIQLEEKNIDNVTRFNITTPQLRAPAALEFLFTARNSSGGQIERRQLLCAIPINEAPDAVDDPFTMTQGTFLSVAGGSDKSLLANDKDDEDVRNQRLEISTTAVQKPRYAAIFQLFSDGGFIYEPLQNAPFSSNNSISDQFVYSVTDGSNTSTATANIRIIAFNSAPVQSTELPEVQATIARHDEDITLFDFASYFSDTESESLIFSEMGISFPESGNLYLTSEGLLRGNPQGGDSGRYVVSLSVSDSVEMIAAEFFLNIVRSNGKNKSPYANDIDNKTVRDEFSYDVSGFFGDSDQDHLAFTATGLPKNVEISPNGVISGISTSGNRGKSFIRVFANDGNGGTANDGFRLNIR